MVRAVTHLKISILTVLIAGLVGCKSSKSSDPGPPPPPPPSGGGSGGGGGHYPLPPEGLFEEAVMYEGIALRINSPEFMRLLQGGQHRRRGSRPFSIQHGRVVRSHELSNGPYCIVSRGNSSTYQGALDHSTDLQIDADSLVRLQGQGSHWFRFSVSQLFWMDCGNSGFHEGPLTVGHFREIVGDLLSVRAARINGPLGVTRIQLLPTRRGGPSIKVEYSLSRRIVSMQFSVAGDQLVGHRADSVAPSYISVMNKQTQASFIPWFNSGLGQGYIQPNSVIPFNFSIDNLPRARELVHSFRSAVIVLSLKNVRHPAPTVYIDLQEICDSHPHKFHNLDTGAVGCP